jgi:hypothetical protein
MKNIRTDYDHSIFGLDDHIDRCAVFNPRSDQDMEKFHFTISNCFESYACKDYGGISREEDKEEYDLFKSQLPTLCSILKLMDRLMDEGKL